MNPVHRSSVSLALSRPTFLGLTGQQILAAAYDDRTYTLLVTDGVVTQVATGRLQASGQEHVRLTPPLLESEGLAHGRIPLNFVAGPIPEEPPGVQALAQHARCAPGAMADRLHRVVRRHDPHRAVRLARERTRRRAEAREALACGYFTVDGRVQRVTLTARGIVLEDDTVLSPDVLDTL